MSVNVNQLAASKAKGKRPRHFQSAEAERTLNIAMVLAQELAVARERIDTLERLLEANGTLRRQDIDSFMPSASQAVERGEWTAAFIARVLRVVQQEIESIGEQKSLAATVEDLRQEEKLP